MPIIPIFLPQETCPFKCIFCDQADTVGKVDMLSIEEVRHQIEESLVTINRDSTDTIQIAFYGGSFTVLPQETQKFYLEAVYEFISNGKVDEIRISTRPDFISNEILDVLKRYKVGTIELGAQILNDEILKVLNRGHTTNDILNAVELIKAHGIKAGIQLMVGLPGETESIRKESWSKVIDLSPDLLRIHPTIVLRDTELHRMYLGNKFSPLVLEEAVSICADLLIDAEKHNLKVIRVGLQSSVALQGEGVVVAGPWHSSFGQLVKGEIYRRMLIEGIKRIDKASDNIEIHFPVKDQSLVIGLKGRNREYFQKEYPEIEFKFKADSDRKPYNILLAQDGKRIDVSLDDI
ncbi:MAG: radical SAM protein [Acidobacteria bacterium]|nr:radical SAM protein [Acidobacteriota bacterium]